ncbi:MAG: hypothetical protein GXP26_06015 [Planctomycetes bacterium]|nr:hypothetical protein [Planctomycetota bacterium]
MHWLRFSYWRLALGVGIVLMVCVAALMLLPRSLSPTEMRLVGAWEKISPEPSTVMILGPNLSFRMTDSDGQIWTGHWKADESNFVYTLDASRMADFVIDSIMGWSNYEDQMPILAIEEGVLKFGTETEPFVFVRRKKEI